MLLESFRDLTDGLMPLLEDNISREQSQEAIRHAYQNARGPDSNYLPWCSLGDHCRSTQ
jgi:hypothetical protein